MLRVRTVLSGVAGAPYYSNLFFEGGSFENAQSAATRVRAFWQAFSSILASPMVANVEDLVPAVDIVTGDITQSLTVDGGATVQFTDSGEKLPPATQLSATLRTGTYFGGRELKGRMFIPGWTTSQNTLNGVPETAVQAAVRDSLLAMATTDNPLVVWSRLRGTAQPVVGITTPSVWSILKSRRD